MPPVPTWFFVISAALFGGIIGSFVNAAIYRLPRDISMLTRSRSFCPRCEAQIAWYDNIPLLSYIGLFGKCRACKQPIPFRYFIVEALVSALFALAAWQYFGLNAPAAPGLPNPMPFALFLVTLLIVADMICIAFVDLETWTIPIQTTWPWILVGILIAPLAPDLHHSMTPWTGTPWLDALLDSLQGVILGAGVLWLIGFVCIVFLGKEGMGGGDAHLVATIGALLGWKPALLVWLVGVFLGSFLGVGQLLWDRYQQRRLGDAWKPRRPTFEMPEEGDEDAGPPPDWILLAMGAFVLIVEGIILAIYSQRGGMLGYESTPISPVLGAVIGCNLLVAYPVKKRMMASGAWPTGEIRERADGKKEEVLEGNYIPFGPSLALAAVLVVFYHPLLLDVFGWWFLRTPVVLPWALPFV